MADPEMSVTPYWELTFDADGDVDGRQRDRLVKEMVQRKVRDLIVFSHGWNTDRSGATRLYSRFFEPVPALAPQARLGYVGVLWPSMRFSDEPIPDLPPSVAAEVPAAARPVLDKGTRHALIEVFPGRATVVEQIARLLDQQPDEGASLEEFGRLVRLLVEVRPGGPQASFAADMSTEGELAGDPLMLFGDTATVCGEFAQALAGLEGPGGASFAMPRLWDGAHELLRQATYYAMKRRAGTVGERGLGPVIGQLAKASPEVRVHLVGHSFGGRLVSFALRGLPEGVRAVKSVTLLQGAFSHYAFAARLPHDPRASGALNGRQNRIDGPLVCCYSRFDSALGTIYPLASRMANDSRTVTADFGIGRKLGPEWGAMGHDGVQAVAGTRAFTLAEALKAKLPATGCVNIDAASVVKRGGSPSGAHSDICHRELAQVVLAAGRVR
ncbi:serine-threonine protein kinase [Streptomyces sp. NBC_01356]|uniref:serine-threonine protein kinase n=1 Tax=Streptomyces sp. NBC_01356 TaxID=2903836 RepID=UPI002E312919|nr:serine-threonine protein kinase [Streptomyces sp. NBC_01356]